MLTAVCGVNWGDEGKGRMVDLLAEDYDVIVRYQGGNNAGHTVINDRGKFVLNLLPSGVFHDSAVNVLGTGMVIDLEHLDSEIRLLKDRNIDITPNRLMISDRAVICMPFHRLQDGLEEDRLGELKQGSTRRGIGPVYSDKYIRKALRMEDLLDTDALRDKVDAYVRWKNLLIQGYGGEAIDAGSIYQWLLDYGAKALPYVADVSRFLNEAARAGKNILFEAQLGALRDIDYGIYPYTSSSTTLASFAATGAGVPALRLDKVIGVVKAFSSSVGEGPFVAEMSGPEAAALREAGGEYGAATGRPRRVGAFDVPASRYGVSLQGADTLALTKLDILRGMERIPVCVAYEIDGKRTGDFMRVDLLNRAKPVIEYRPGFDEDISGVRNFADLPRNVRDYVMYIQDVLERPVEYLSVGARRDEYIYMRR